MTTSMKPKIIISVVVGILVIVVIIFFVQSSSNDVKEENSNSIIQNPISSQDTNDPLTENVDTIKLEAVGTYAGNGTANRTYDGENFIHLVVAKIDPPAVGKFYEGWLVKNGIPISTGKLISEGDDYSLLFTSEVNYSNHNQVVITEETERLGLDGNPETHVLEGNFL